MSIMSYVQIIDSYDRVRLVEEEKWPHYENKEACVVLGVVELSGLGDSVMKAGEKNLQN